MSNKTPRKSKSHTWHPNTQMSEWESFDKIVKAKGMWLEDENGNKMIDAVASMWCNVWGHSKDDLVMELARQVKKLQHTPMFNLTNEPSEKLAKYMIDINPKMEKVFFSDNGSSAMEIAVKMAIQYWRNEGCMEKTMIASLENGYHGDTFGAMSIGYVPEFFGNFKKQLFPIVRLPVPDKHHTPRNLTYTEYQKSCLEDVEQKLEGNESISALVMESGAQVAGGVVIYPYRFQQKIAKICKKHDILFVLDEIATGFGRLGSMTEYSAQNSIPDIVSFGKMMTGGYLSMAATLATKKVYESFLGEFAEHRHLFHGHTYTGNPLASAVANKNIEMYKEYDLIKKIRITSSIFQRYIPEIKSLNLVGNVRYKGMLLGIELLKNGIPVSAKQSVNKIIYTCGQKNGIYLRTLGNILMLVPPLAISHAELEILIAKAIKTITDAEKFF